MKTQTIGKFVLTLAASAAAAVGFAAQTEYTWQSDGSSLSGTFTDPNHWDLGAAPGTGYPDLANVNQTGVFSADGTGYTVTYPSGAFTNLAGLKASVPATAGSSIRFVGADTLLEMPATDGVDNWPWRVFELDAANRGMFFNWGQITGYASALFATFENFDFTLSRDAVTNLLDFTKGTYTFYDRVDVLDSKCDESPISVVRIGPEASLSVGHDLGMGCASYTNLLLVAGGTLSVNQKLRIPVGDAGSSNDEYPTLQVLHATDGANVTLGTGPGTMVYFGATYLKNKTSRLVADKKSTIYCNAHWYTEGHCNQQIFVDDATVRFRYGMNYSGYNGTTGLVHVVNGGTFQTSDWGYGCNVGIANATGTGFGRMLVEDNGLIYMPYNVKVYHGEIRVGQGGTLRAQTALCGMRDTAADSFFVADGGTLHASRHADSGVVFLSGFSSAEVAAGGLTLVADHRATVSQDFTGSGTLTVNGGSTLTVKDCTIACPFVLSSGTTLVADGVTFGDLTIEGTLSHNPAGDPITVTGALDFSQGSFSFTSDLAAGTYTVFASTVAQSAAVKSEWEIFANVTKGLVSGKYYSFRCEEEDGVTYFRIYAFDAKPSLSDDCTWAGPGASWNEAANWSGNAVPGSTNRVVFAGAAPANVTVPSATYLAALAFTSDAQSYRISGADLKFAANEGNGVTVSAGSHEVATPLLMNEAMSFAISDESALELSGTVTGGGFTKSGNGRLSVTGTGNRVLSPFALSGGLLSFGSVATMGNPPSGTSTFTDGTLEIGADGGGAYAPGLAIDSAKAVIFKTESDLKLPMSSVTKGAIVKRGAGSLTFDVSSGLSFNIKDYPLSSQHATTYADLRELEFDDDYGTVPSGNYAALDVFEGDFVLHSTAASQPKVNFLNHQADIFIGTPNASVTASSAPARLVLDGVYAYTLNDYINIGGGVLSDSDCPMTSSLVLTNGAKVTHALAVTLAGGTAKPGYSASIDVYDSTFSCVSFGLNGSYRSDVTNRVRCVNSEFIVDFKPEVHGSCEMDFDNSWFHLEKGDRMLKISYHDNFDDQLQAHLSFRNNSSFWCNEFRHNNGVAHYQMQPVVLEFDNSEFYLGASGGTLWTSNLDVRVTANAGGIRFAPEAGTNWTFSTQITGVGGLIKEGAGTLFVDRFFRYGRYETTDTCTLACDGVNTVKAGTLSVAQNAAKAGSAFAVSSGALLTLNGGLLDTVSVSGAGTVANGTLATPVLKVAYDDKKGTTTAPTLDLADGLVLSGRVTVDFGRTAENPLPEKFKGLVVARYTGDVPPDVSAWRGVNTGVGVGLCRFAVDAANRTVVASSKRGCVLFLR